MFQSLCLMVSLLMLPMSAWAAKPYGNMMANLLKRCNDGVAVACYDYGKALLAVKKNPNVKRGNYYVRRACTLAYAPACQQRSKPVNSKASEDNHANSDANGLPCNGEELAKAARLSEDGKEVTEVVKGSLWEQSGIQPGDKIISVNGQAFNDADQIAKSLNTGSAVIHVLRQGRETPVTVNCP